MSDTTKRAQNIVARIGARRTTTHQTRALLDDLNELACIVEVMSKQIEQLTDQVSDHDFLLNTQHE